MKLKVNVAGLGSGGVPEDSILLYCGNGEQILRWVGYTACSRLAYKRGDVCSCYVPQSILTKEGQALDVDIVLKEVLNDGDEVFVEYSSGPQAYRVRWEGRPSTPPFDWNEDGEVLPPHSQWLLNLNLKQEGIHLLMDSGMSDTDKDKDLVIIKNILKEHAGPLQMVFLFHECDGSKNVDELGKLTLPQFRAAMQGAKIASTSFPPERIDEIFSFVVTSENTLNRKVAANTAVSAFTFLDFLIAIIHISHHWYEAEIRPNRAGNPALSSKVELLVNESFVVFTLPEMQKRVEKFNNAGTTGAGRILEGGRRLTEQTLNMCQLKRVRQTTLTVELKYICNHLQRWALLGREFTFQELAVMVMWALHTTKTSGARGEYKLSTRSNPGDFALQPVNLDFDYDHFEMLLLAICYHMYLLKKKHEPFEEFLGESLEMIYKKAGVLI